MNDGSIGSTFKGRTSRGTMALMHDYAELINELRPTAEQFTEIEQYWVKRIQAFFTSKPFKLESDNSLSVDGRQRSGEGRIRAPCTSAPSCSISSRQSSPSLLRKWKSTARPLLMIRVRGFQR